MRISACILAAALLGLLCARSSGVVAGDIGQEDASLTTQASHDPAHSRPSLAGHVLARPIERDGDKAIIQVADQFEVITRDPAVSPFIANTRIKVPKADIQDDTVDDRVRRFRREGLPVVQLWKTQSAAINVGLNTKRKPGLWYVQKIS